MAAPRSTGRARKTAALALGVLGLLGAASLCPTVAQAVGPAAPSTSLQWFPQGGTSFSLGMGGGKGNIDSHYPGESVGVNDSKFTMDQDVLAAGRLRLGGGVQLGKLSLPGNFGNNADTSRDYAITTLNVGWVTPFESQDANWEAYLKGGFDVVSPYHPYVGAEVGATWNTHQGLAVGPTVELMAQADNPQNVIGTVGVKLRF